MKEIIEQRKRVIVFIIGILFLIYKGLTIQLNAHKFNLLNYKVYSLEKAYLYDSIFIGWFGILFASLNIFMLIVSIDKQSKMNNIQKFENVFFQLLHLHRENVSEVSLNTTKGRAVFVVLIREYREILKKVKELLKSVNLTEVDIINISYLILFYGTGPNSNRILQSSLKNALKEKNIDDDEIINEIIDIFSTQGFKKDVKKIRKFSYTPFEGHQSRLGHYFRHIYQSFCYIKSQNFLSKKQKYEYAKILRAQLSSHELALLVLNALSDLGKDWVQKDYNIFDEYQVIKNIPNDFFDLEEEFDIKQYFGYIKFNDNAF